MIIESKSFFNEFSLFFNKLGNLQLNEKQKKIAYIASIIFASIPHWVLELSFKFKRKPLWPLLAIEIQDIIFSYLDYPIAIRRVCQHWKCIIDRNYFSEAVKIKKFILSTTQSFDVPENIEKLNLNNLEDFKFLQLINLFKLQQDKIKKLEDSKDNHTLLKNYTFCQISFDKISMKFSFQYFEQTEKWIEDYNLVLMYRLLPVSRIYKIDIDSENIKTTSTDSLSLSNLGSDIRAFLPQSQIKKISTLNLNQNFTEIPPEIKYLSCLKKLECCSNTLRILPKEISLLTQLIHLNLANNSFSKIPEELFNLTQLNTLHLYNNKITIIPSTITSLVALKTLNLNDNQITIISLEIIQCPSLSLLFLSNNPLEKNLKTEIQAMIDNGIIQI